MKYEARRAINAIQHLISLTGIDCLTAGKARPPGDVGLVHTAGYFRGTDSTRWSLSEVAHGSPRSPRSAWSRRDRRR